MSAKRGLRIWLITIVLAIIINIASPNILAHSFFLQALLVMLFYFALMAGTIFVLGSSATARYFIFAFYALGLFGLIAAYSLHAFKPISYKFPIWVMIVQLTFLWFFIFKACPAFVVLYGKSAVKIAGDIGEELVAERLEGIKDRFANETNLHIINGALLKQTENDFVEYDHIVVGAGWLLVLETKATKGTVWYDSDLKSWYRDAGYGVEIMNNPLKQNVRQCAFLQTQYPDMRVVGCVVFTRAQYEGDPMDGVLFGIQNLNSLVTWCVEQLTIRKSDTISIDDTIRSLKQININSAWNRYLHTQHIALRHGVVTKMPSSVFRYYAASVPIVVGFCILPILFSMAKNAIG